MRSAGMAFVVGLAMLSPGIGRAQSVPSGGSQTKTGDLTGLLPSLSPKEVRYKTPDGKTMSQSDFGAMQSKIQSQISDNTRAQRSAMDSASSTRRPDPPTPVGSSGFSIGSFLRRLNPFADSGPRPITPVSPGTFSGGVGRTPASFKPVNPR